jgi:hypothetical protein
MSNPRPITPNVDPTLGPNPAPGRSVAEDMGEVVDELRQLHTDLGMRPYRVFSVVLRWSGGEPGRGTAEVVSEREFLPTPLADLRPLTRVVTSGGVVERGGSRLSELSPRYTEDDIKALFFVQPLPKGHQGFIEITVDARDGQSPRRRFTVKSPPIRDASGWEWTVRLESEDEARTRAGEVQGPRRHYERKTV